MARSAKSRTDKTEAPSIVDPIASAAAVPDILPDPVPETGPKTVAETVPETVPETGPETDSAPGIEAALPWEPEHLPEPEPVQPRLADPAPPASERPVAAPAAGVIVKKVGFGPLVLGGIIAAALGYVAAIYGQPGRSTDTAALEAAQTDRIAALAAQLAALPAPVDLSPLTTGLTQVQAAVSAGQAETVTALATLEGRLSALEKAPNADGTLSATAIASWEAELQTLRADIDVQQARMRELADAATAQLDQTRADAATLEQTSADSVAAVTARAALARVQAALDAGTPFDAALRDLSATVAVPAALTALAAEGAPTMLTLQTEFPAAARAALATARNEGLAGEEGGGIAAFLRNQFDVRSVSPQSGATVDAILSRAEDDLHQNRLTDALAEVATLPEVVRAEMAGWTGPAEARIAAVAAVEGLSQSLTSN